MLAALEGHPGDAVAGDNKERNRHELSKDSFCGTSHGFRTGQRAVVVAGSSPESTVSPDKPQDAAPAPVLSQQDRERLLSLTRVVVSPEASKEQPQDAAVLSAEDNERLTREIEAADQLLGKLSKDSSPAASELMARLLDASEPGIRATALRWLAGRPDAPIQALARGITDQHSMVRLVTEQILIEYGASDDQIARVTAARKDGRDKVALELRAFLQANQ